MTIEFGFIGWCNEGNHDKIWGYIVRPSNHSKYVKNCCIFWGRRGNAMQFKHAVDDYALSKVVKSKGSKGYISINEDNLTEIWPTFMEELKVKLSFEVLTGKIK